MPYRHYFSTFDSEYTIRGGLIKST